MFRILLWERRKIEEDEGRVCYGAKSSGGSRERSFTYVLGERFVDR